MRTETIDLNGHPFFIRHWGNPDKPLLLMLHGFPEHSGAWAELAPLLTDRYHCVAPDQRGYGRSWAPDGVENYAAGLLAGDMAALIDHFGGTATVLGHDWGAAVAYTLTMRHGEKVDRLIIANGVHPVPFQRAVAKGGAQCEASQYIRFLRREGSEDILGANNFDKMMEVFSAKMDLSWLTPERSAEYKAAWGHDGGRLKTMIHWYRASQLIVGDPGKPLTDLPEFPRDPLMIRCPHLLIWGQGDTALLPETTDGLEEFAPDLTRVIVPDADHWIEHQKPNEMARIILDWTAKQDTVA